MSHIRIPPTVETIAPNTFLRCGSLISVELPEGILVRNVVADEDNGLFDDQYERDFTELYVTQFARFIKLVNLAIPTLPEDDEVVSGLLYDDSWFGNVVEDGADLTRKLKHRFDNSPLNSLCYYQSYHSSEDTSLMENEPLAATSQVDECGMIPLHVLYRCHKLQIWICC
eukprot:scaffold2594_cov85-Cylindrotheca_fusiformis.AAC.9